MIALTFQKRLLSATIFSLSTSVAFSATPASIDRVENNAGKTVYYKSPADGTLTSRDSNSFTGLETKEFTLFSTNNNSHNSVDFSVPAIDKRMSVYGGIGEAFNESSDDNRLRIHDTKIDHGLLLLGGYTLRKGDAKGNRLTLERSDIRAVSIGGAYAIKPVSEAQPNDATIAVNNNELTIDNASNVSALFVFGGSNIASNVDGTTLSADGNKVTIRGQVTMLDQNDMKEEISNGSYSGYLASGVVGGYYSEKLSLSASNNELIFDNATVLAPNSIIGAGVIKTSLRNNMSIKNNAVHLLGTSYIKGFVLSGIAIGGPQIEFRDSLSDNNRIFVRGSVTVDTLELPAINIIGGQGYDLSSLMGYHTLDIEISEHNRETAALLLKGQYGLDLRGKVLHLRPSADLKHVGSYLLIDAREVSQSERLDENTPSDSKYAPILMGKPINDFEETADKPLPLDLTKVELDTTFLKTPLAVELNEDKNLLTINFDDTPLPDPSHDDNTQTLSQTFHGALRMVDDGANMALENALPQAHAAQHRADATHAPFASVYGSTGKLKSNPKLDLDTQIFMAGSALKLGPNTTGALFLEYAMGDSDVKLSNISASADHKGYGVGLALEHEFNDQFYAATSVRVGRTETKFNGVFEGDSVHYKAKAPYASLRLQAGWRHTVTETITTDLYARYGLNYIGGDTVALHNRTNDTLDASCTTTSTLRIGGLVNVLNTQNWDAALGAAYERTFGSEGKTAVVVFGHPYDVDATSLDGNTGIFTAKVGYHPETAKAWSFGLHVDGFVGDRQGVAGTFTTTYSF